MILPIGIFFRDKFISNSTTPLLFAAFFGTAATLLYVMIVAFWLPLNTKVAWMWLIINLIIVLYNGKKWRNEKRFNIHFKALAPYSWSVLIGIFAIVWASTSAPILTDEGTYFEPTIRWLREYGWVKGLGNLHFFLATASPWHAFEALFQSVWQISTVHALNSWWLLISFVQLFQLAAVEKNKNFGYLLWIPIIMLPYWLIMASSASTDVAGWLWVFWGMYGILIQSNDKEFPSWVAVLFGLMAFNIKPTFMPALLVFTVYFLVKNHTHRFRLLFISTLFISVWMMKNVRLTGYYLFPNTILNTEFKYAIPQYIISYYFDPYFRFGNGLTVQQYHTLATSELLVKWFGQCRFESIVALITIVLWCAFGIGCRFKLNMKNQTYTWIWAASGLYLLIIACTSPQGRFYAIVPIVMGLGLFQPVIQRWKRIFPMVTLGVVLFVLFQTKWGFTDGIHPAQSKKLTYQIDQFIWPQTNPTPTYSKQQCGRLHYYSPPKGSYFWWVGNGPLPSVNQQEIQFFEQLGWHPEPIGSSPAEGYQTVYERP
ncbi:MAG: hypothetical protein CFE24_02890 [Flavobacterium sp. BFFFF2]|nr:MAG: hypothetical protein CFE24_02890 [Flavobacterium sp. BFFFF2]